MQSNPVSITAKRYTLMHQVNKLYDYETMDKTNRQLLFGSSSITNTLDALTYSNTVILKPNQLHQ